MILFIVLKQKAMTASKSRTLMVLLGERATTMWTIKVSGTDLRRMTAIVSNFRIVTIILMKKKMMIWILKIAVTTLHRMVIILVRSQVPTICSRKMRIKICVLKILIPEKLTSSHSPSERQLAIQMPGARSAVMKTRNIGLLSVTDFQQSFGHSKSMIQSSN